MVEYSDEVLIIWDGTSKGTKYTADYAKKMNKKLIEIRVDYNV